MGFFSDLIGALSKGAFETFLEEDFRPAVEDIRILTSRVVDIEESMATNGALDALAHDVSLLRDRVKALEEGGGLPSWRLLEAPITIPSSSLVLLKNGVPLDGPAAKLNAVISGAGLTVRFEPTGGIPGSETDVLEVGIRGIQSLLGPRWSGYFSWIIGASFTLQGSGAKYILHASSTTLQAWEDGAKVGWRFANPDISAAPGELDFHILGEKPLTCRMPWFNPPWHPERNDIFAATFVL